MVPEKSWWMKEELLVWLPLFPRDEERSTKLELRRVLR